MKTFIAIACLLLAASQCSANAILDSVDGRVTCAEDTFDAIKAVGVGLVDQYGARLEALRGNYTACNQLPTGGQREQCHLEFGRYVVQVLLGLREQLQLIKNVALQFTLEQLDGYFACRQADARFELSSNNTASYCAVVSVFF